MRDDSPGKAHTHSVETFHQFIDRDVPDAAIVVVIPTFREAESIVGVVEGVLGALRGREVCVAVIDDSPTSATVDALRDRYGGRLDPGTPRVIWTHRQGDGLASAVVDGFRQHPAQTYVVMDGDGQHPPERVAELVGAVESGADLAVGSRHAEGGAVDGDWPLHRRIISAGADSLARAAVPRARHLSDPMSGFFAVDGDLVGAVLEQLRPEGYKILLELVARAPVTEIHEVGYEFRERQGGESNLGPREYARYVRHLLRLTVPARRPSVRVLDAAEVAEA